MPRVNDPHVLLGAYHLFIEQGLEEERPEAGEWFRKALALSGPEGPVQSFELKRPVIAADRLE